MKREDFKNITNAEVEKVKRLVVSGGCHGKCGDLKCPFAYPYNNRVNFSAINYDALNEKEMTIYMELRNCPHSIAKAGFIPNDEFRKACNEFIQMFSATKIDLTE